MASLADAVALIKRGIPIFRLRAGTKDGYVDFNWDRGDATLDPAEVYDRFVSGQYNIGAWGGGRFIYIDVDDGAAWEAWLKQHGPIPETFTVRTPSGGLHFYFDAGGEIFGQTDLVPKKINVRAAGGYVVGPGSVGPNKHKPGEYGPYVIANNAPIALLPDNLRGHLRALSERKKDKGTTIAGELDTPPAIEKARARLAAAAPAIQGAGGDNATFRLACEIFDFGLSVETCLALMLELWDFRCEPPWGPDGLRVKVQNSWNYREAAVGRDNPSAGIEPVAAELQALLARSTPAAIIAAMPGLLKFPDELSMAEFITKQDKALVKGILSPGELLVIYGDPGSGKSFLMLDMGFAIVQNRLWHGRKTKKAPVLYVCLEGVDGFDKRTYAALREHGDPKRWFGRLNVHVSLVRAAVGEEGAQIIIEAYSRLMAGVGATTPGLIIIDTVARATAGDNENDVADMMAFIEHRAGAIARATGAAVGLVHHANKAGKIRGSTSQPAAGDCILKAVREEETGARSLTAEKVKDGEEGLLFAYALKVVQLGVDTDGDAITSCIVRVRDPARVSECKTVTVALMERALKLPEPINLGDKLRGQHYAPKWLHENQDASPRPAFTLAEFSDALSDLVREGRLKIEHHGAKTRNLTRYAFTTLPAPPAPAPEPEPAA